MLPTWRSISAKAGQPRSTASERSISRCVTAPPMVSSPFALTCLSSGIRFTSTSAVNSVSPIFATSKSSVPPE
jgi:hypothetical protein